MSKALNPMQQLEAALSVMPESAEGLQQFIANAVSKLNTIPENQLIQAENTLKTLLRLVQEERVRVDRNARRPVVTSTYYRGSLRAVVGRAEEGDFFVTFTQESKGPDGRLILEDAELNGVAIKRPVWVDLELDPNANILFSKLVLSQPVQPGDVYYITTAVGIEAHMELMTDLVGKVEETAEAVAGKTDEQLLAEAQAADQCFTAAPAACRKPDNEKKN